MKKYLNMSNLDICTLRLSQKIFVGKCEGKKVKKKGKRKENEKKNRELN